MYLIDCFPFFYALSTVEESSEDIRMSVKDEEFKTKIYDLMNGSYNLEEYPVVESSLVKDEFAEGEYCEKLYSQMLEAYERVCQKTWKARRRRRRCRDYHIEPHEHRQTSKYENV